jgi:hypothetical protein
MAKLRELWGELQTSAPSESAVGFAMRLLHVDRDVRVYAAVTNPGSEVALVVELPNVHRPKDLTRISTRTFEAVVADFPGLSAGRCAISVRLRMPEYVDLFALLGNEIVRALTLSHSTADACRAVVRSIDRWRRFVEKNRRAMSDEEVRGLIGELVVLCRASARFGHLGVVQAWQGPTGSLRDFELPDFAVEVKTYQADTGATVRINDPQQLEGTHDRPAYLAIMRLARSQTLGRSLPDFVAFAEELLKSDIAALDVFQDRLAAAGYLPSQAEHYPDRYSAAPTQMFQVTTEFPRIRPDQVPGSVRDVHFSIIVSGLTEFAVDATSLLGASVGLETE